MVANSGTVRNGSELAKGSAMGRPAVLDDDALLAVAEELNHALGRPPRLDELIQAAGGCQRQRASRTIRKLREQLAAKSVRALLLMPPELESDIRQWIDRWMGSAAQQLAAEHAELLASHDQAIERANDLIGEQQTVIAELREGTADQQRMTSELFVRTQALGQEVQKLTAERDIAHALAEDRLKLIERWEVSRAK